MSAPPAKAQMACSWLSGTVSAVSWITDAPSGDLTAHGRFFQQFSLRTVGSPERTPRAGRPERGLWSPELALAAN